MRTICKRLHCGEDLLGSIQEIAEKEQLELATVFSSVGCVSRVRLRDASGVTVQAVEEPCEIVSLQGTVSAKRCHLHASFSKEDLSTIGGHLMKGCIVNTTCELVLVELEDWGCAVEQDTETGYDEIVFLRR